MLTKRQIEWAAGHDWVLADLGNGTILVIELSELIGDIARPFAGSFRELRDWAGY